MRPADPWRHFPVAMGYVPWQNLHTLYEPDKALQVGTIFPELNKPFEGRRIGC
ncbi:MAG: spore coat associated protein CotJA [Lachnospiraceae bacterium]|nr:spore coat associated protein CotJA [Lachnospiraceae bacterium]MDD6192557.1 spore coat associated protein CotJA [Lachnospiraceae bacterium]